MSKSRTGRHWVMSEEGKKSLRHPKSEAGKMNIRIAANKPERIEKLRAAWVLRKQKMAEKKKEEEALGLRLAIGA